jgi:ATP synthase protein I
MTPADAPDGSTPERDRVSKPTVEDVSARLASLRAREAKDRAGETRRQGQAQGIGLGMRIGIELVASVLVGAGLGWYVDQKLHTRPIFLLALVALGFTAGVMNVIRISKGLDDREGIGRIRRQDSAPAAPPGGDDDDDD